MEGKVFVAFALGIESGETFTGNDVAFEVPDLAFVQELFAMGVFATDVSAAAGSSYELFAVEMGEKICGLSFKRVAFGFAG